MMTLKPKIAGTIFAALALLGGGAVHAQSTDLRRSPGQEVRQPAPGIAQIPLWPSGLAIAQPEITGGETAKDGGVTNVARPTMAIYPAKGPNTGAAVMVYPGGGYRMLAIGLEGTEICEWLTANDITCVVLKYRVPQTWWPKDQPGERAPRVQMALQDAQRAMGLLRQRARSLGIDPHKIGVLGFSAGGHLVTAISNAAARTYPAVDAADQESSRPDFAVALYPGHLWSRQGLDLSPWNTISSHAPPTFLVQAEDDPVDDVRNSVAYFLALRAAKVPVEMHIYAHGGHAFGLRPTAMPITHWPKLVEQWLHTIGMLADHWSLGGTWPLPRMEKICGRLSISEKLVRRFDGGPIRPA
jgi:acetyl esterase/lipase